MSEAKGILPVGEDRPVLTSPQTCGYFIGLRLQDGIDRQQAEAWLTAVDGMVGQLVEPPADAEQAGAKVAAVAVGFGPAFFERASGFDPPLEPPAGFADGAPAPQAIGPLAGVPPMSADALFYVASMYEALVYSFASALSGSQGVSDIWIERGYQRTDGTEPFGYRDGVRNAVPAVHRPKVVFVHREELEADEPEWAEGGTYLAYLKIEQSLDKFKALQPSQQDAAIGRTRDGHRLDTPEVEPGREDNSPPPQLPPTAHVRKAGPSGLNDDVEIFRRGMPYMETDGDGQLHVGLQFCSFQASLDQFDVVFNDWCLNQHFPSVQPSENPGPDALLDPAKGLTTIKQYGFFFVPPHQSGGLAAALMSPTKSQPKEGHLVVHKTVHDQADPTKRLLRRDFVFAVTDAQGHQVGSDFTTDGTGRAKLDTKLTIGEQYTLQEKHSPISGVAPQPQPFTMSKPNMSLKVVNTAGQPSAYA